MSDTAYGPNLQPELDRKVTCPACQQRTPAAGPCDLCGGTMLVRQGTRDRWIVERELNVPITGPVRNDGVVDDPYDVP